MTSARARRIITATAAAFGMAEAALTGESRLRSIVGPRQVAMLLLRDLLNLSYPAIAKALRRLDHTTAMHGIKAAQVRIEGDPDLAAIVAGLRATLQG